MIVRVVTGLVLAPVAIWLVLFAPQWAGMVFFGLIAWLGVGELLRMWPEPRPLDRVLGGLVATLVALWPAIDGHSFLALLALAPVLLLAAALWRPDDLVAAATRATISVLAVGYIGVMCAAIVAIWQIAGSPGGSTGELPPAATTGLGGYSFGHGAVLFLLVVVFFGDTGAYFSGRALGRHKLSAAVSPKKTVEGAIGGLVASTLGGWLAAVVVLPGLGLVEALALGALCGLVGQVGDLAESLFKRAHNTKDSGRLLPGHGGVLDRLDGVLFAAPVLYAWLVLLRAS